MPVGLVEAEHERAADAVLVHHPEQLVRPSAHSVDVVAEMDVRVEDLEVGGKLAQDLFPPGREEVARSVERFH